MLLQRAAVQAQAPVSRPTQVWFQPEMEIPTLVQGEDGALRIMTTTHLATRKRDLNLYFRCEVMRREARDEPWQLIWDEDYPPFDLVVGVDQEVPFLETLRLPPGEYRVAVRLFLTKFSRALCTRSEDIVLR